MTKQTKQVEPTYIKLEIIKNNGEEYLVVPDGMNFYSITNSMGDIVLLQKLDTFTEYPQEMEDITTKMTEQVELAGEVGVIVSKIDDIIRSEWGASIYKEVGGADIAGQIEKVVSSVLAQAQQGAVEKRDQKIVDMVLNAHEHARTLEERKALEEVVEMITGRRFAE